MTPTNTSIDRAKIFPTSSIDKAKMIPASFTAIDYEEWLFIRVFWGQSKKNFFQMQNADKVILEVGLF